MHDGNHTKERKKERRKTRQPAMECEKETHTLPRDRTNPIHFVVSHISFYGHACTGCVKVGFFAPVVFISLLSLLPLFDLDL